MTSIINIKLSNLNILNLMIVGSIKIDQLKLLFEH